MVQIVTADKMIAPYSPQFNGMGFNQYYSGFFDEEGDAIVAAKLAIQNTGKEDVNAIIIEIPGKSVQVINALQESLETRKECR